MSKRIGVYPRVRLEGGVSGVVSQAGAVLLVETVRKVGLDTSISAAMAPWHKPRTVHDPGKVLLDVALATALGGDCLADVAMLRAEPDMFGPVASDPTVSRLIDTLASAGPKALTAIRTARAEVRSRVWELAGADSPAADGQVIVDIDGVPVLAHSEKQDATPTWKKTFGHHPLVAFVDHGPAGSGEPVAALPRPGNVGSNTAADHIETSQLALAQLPKHLRRGHQTLIRTDSAGGTHTFLDWLSRPGRWLSYSVGMTITDTLHQAVLKIPKKCPVSLNRVAFSTNRVVRASVSANPVARLSALGGAGWGPGEADPESRWSPFPPTTAAEPEYSRVVRWPRWGVTR